MSLCRRVTYSDPYGLQECDKDQQADGYKGCKESELPEGKCWTQQADGWRECTQDEMLKRVDEVGAQLVREYKTSAAVGVATGGIASALMSRLQAARTSAVTALALTPVNPTAQRALGFVEGNLAALPPGPLGDLPEASNAARMQGQVLGVAFMTGLKLKLGLP